MRIDDQLKVGTLEIISKAMNRTHGMTTYQCAEQVVCR